MIDQSAVLQNFTIKITRLATVNDLQSRIANIMGEEPNYISLIFRYYDVNGEVTDYNKTLLDYLKQVIFSLLNSKIFSFSAISLLVA